MMRVLIGLGVVLITTACAQLPDIQPTDALPSVTGEACLQIFPLGNWQFLHTIEAIPPTGRRQTLLGLSQLSSSRRSGRFVIMTIEGLVVFDAHLDGAIDVRKAVPPFDRPGMAAGIIDDLKLLFFTPDQPAIALGTTDSGNRICRFTVSQGGIQDIEIGPDGQWTVSRYSHNNRLIRTIAPVAERGRTDRVMPNQIVLKALGPVGYRLVLTLIESEPLPDAFKP